MATQSNNQDHHLIEIGVLEDLVREINLRFGVSFEEMLLIARQILHEGLQDEAQQLMHVDREAQ